MPNPTAPGNVSDIEVTLGKMAEEVAYVGSPTYNQVETLLRRAYDLGMKEGEAKRYDIDVRLVAGECEPGEEDANLMHAIEMRSWEPPE